MKDNWAERSTYICKTCFFYYKKSDEVGRCRRHAPTMNGFPVVYNTDVCGDHKLDHLKLLKPWKFINHDDVRGYECPKCGLIYKTIPDSCKVCRTPFKKV